MNLCDEEIGCSYEMETSSETQVSEDINSSSQMELAEMNSCDGIDQISDDSDVSGLSSDEEDEFTYHDQIIDSKEDFMFLAWTIP